MLDIAQIKPGTRITRPAFVGDYGASWSSIDYTVVAHCDGVYWLRNTCDDGAIWYETRGEVRQYLAQPGAVLVHGIATVTDDQRAMIEKQAAQIARNGVHGAFFAALDTMLDWYEENGLLELNTRRQNIEWWACQNAATGLDTRHEDVALMRITRKMERIASYWCPDCGKMRGVCQCASEWDEWDGKCPACGDVIAGSEAEGWYLREYGVCSNCYDEIRAELDEEAGE